MPALAGQRRAAGLDDVAVGCGRVVPQHPLVSAEVGPPVARTLEATRRLHEPRPGDQRGGGLRVVGDERRVRAVAAVVVAGVGQRRVGEHIQLIGATRQRLEADVDGDRGAAGIGDVCLGQPPAVLLVGVGLAVGQAVRVQQRRPLHRRVLLSFGEAVPVGDDELQIAVARGVEPRVVDLGQLTALEREPDLAGGRSRSAEAVLVGWCPVGLCSRGTWRHAPRARRRVGRRAGVRVACSGGFSLQRDRRDDRDDDEHQATHAVDPFQRSVRANLAGSPALHTGLDSDA